MAEKKVDTYGADIIYVRGSVLKQALYERVKKYDELYASLLSQIAGKVTDACGENEDPAEKAAALMVVLEDGYGLSAHALALRSFIQRAAHAQRESRELSRFGRTLMSDTIYELTWDEADRFGI